MSRATRTINPLHFEDLEPHRFEDLIRQLAHGFRPWRYLDATGRLGADGGMDIRGVELVTVPADPEVEAVEVEDGDPAVEITYSTVTDERVWRIQCKRYKEIGPTLMRTIVGEVVPDPVELPYGLVIAAACDVSAQTMAAFREEANARGVGEAHLWTKAHLEDLLFLPSNDHLLFAYFDISLGVRRRSGLQRIRDTIALKRKLLRAFNTSSTEGDLRADVLIRDIDDDAYPESGRVPDFDSLACPPWHFGQVRAFAVTGILVHRYTYDGWIKEDGSWDILDESRDVVSGRSANFDYEDETQRANWERKSKRRMALQAKIPDSENHSIQEWWYLRYADILEVDPIGDPFQSVPHLYCRFGRENGPYVGRPFLIPHGEREALLDEKREALFDAIRDELP